MVDWIYANHTHSTITNEKDGVVFITFPKLVKAGVRHGCSTRMGGVSKGRWESMNLSFKFGDDQADVYENFRRIGNAIGFCCDDLVFSAQVHDSKIRKVGKENRGEGILRDTVPGIDAVVTSDHGVPMYTSYADCVPLFFYDPVREVIAMAHSGWRGTVARIGAKTIAFMQEEYGSDPADIIAAIGPSICQKCYEVSEDVIEEFKKAYTEEECEQIYYAKGGGKYQLDLWKANQLVLLSAGIRQEHMDITDICTCCNHDKLFSHRATKGNRGSLACFMMLDE